MVSEAPWIISKFKERGFAYRDILYAIRVQDIESDDFLIFIRRLPTIRLYRDALHLGAWLTVEIKPCRIDGRPETETRDHAVKYSTWTASIMLHEELKLCYMASDDPHFFKPPRHLHSHFVAAVGYTAYHYIHCLRPHEPSVDKPDIDVKYQSYLLKTFDLSNASDRNEFRRTVNQIHIYQINIIRHVKLERPQKLSALDAAELERRLESRTHKYIRFSHGQRENEWGLKVHDDTPRDSKGEHSANHCDIVERMNTGENDTSTRRRQSSRLVIRPTPKGAGRFAQAISKRSGQRF